MIERPAKTENKRRDKNKRRRLCLKQAEAVKRRT
jgi:hypothetical protein